jgi:hypothetical protein
LSLGDQGWAESPTSVLANALSEKGVAVSAAAGNAGEKGVFEVGSPAVGHRVVSVASVDNTMVLQFAIIVNGMEFCKWFREFRACLRSQAIFLTE